MITEVQLRLSPKDASDAGTVKNAAARAAGVKHSGVNAVQVLRRSIDARGRNVTIQMSAVVFSGSDFPEKTPPAEYPDVSGKEEIIIVGSGPAGMFAALRAIENGASEEIITDARPHIGTNKLPGVVENIRKRITACGGSYVFNSRVTGLVIENGAVKGVTLSDGTKYESRAVILATGHSARDIYRLLYSKGILMQPKGIAVGVRIEHPQELIDRIQYGPGGRGEYLPAASYKLVEQCGGRGVYSFCMCPGGYIVPSATEQQQVVVNGMSPSSRDNKYANSGIVVAVNPQDIPEYSASGIMAVLDFVSDMEKRAWEAGGCRQSAPAARMTDFCTKKTPHTLNDTSYQPGITPSDLDYVLGGFVAPRLRDGLVAFGRKMRGFYTEQANLIGVETRTSSPLRIPRDAVSLSHPQVSGLFPCGEGAGYAGGIVSAAIDGENCALAAVSYLKGSV